MYVCVYVCACVCACMENVCVCMNVSVSVSVSVCHVCPPSMADWLFEKKQNLNTGHYLPPFDLHSVIPAGVKGIINFCYVTAVS